MPIFDSSWFKKLKEIIKIHININKLVNIQNIHITNNYSSKQVEYDEKNNLLGINYKKFSPTEKNRIKEIARESQSQATTFLDRESHELVRDIISKEELSDVKSLLQFFRNKIPSDDFIALRSAIYIKKRFEEGKKFEEIYKLKGEVGRRFGGRGLKICNLYASGYFENMIKPLYEELDKQNSDAKDFLNKYDIIINEEAFAIFVQSSMSQAEVKTAIETKIIRNVKYGRQEVTIHGIGKSNVIKIREAISEIEDDGQYSIIKKDIEEKGHIILAKLSF